MSNFSIDGLVTGLNTTEIISQLMSVERAPVRLMQAKVATFNAQLAAWKDLATRLASLSTASADLATTSRLALYSASTSSPAVSAVASGSATPASLTLRVQSLAAAHQVATGGVAAPASLVGAGTATLGPGLPVLGLAGAAADASLATGTHSVVVQQSSTAAAVSAGMWTGPVTVAGGADQLDVVVNGAARSVTVPAGTYDTLDSLAAAVASAAGPGLTAAAVDGRLVLRTVVEGSSATLQLTGGTGAAALGLAPGSAVAGTDGIVSLDGVDHTVTAVTAGATVSLASTAGALTVTLGSGLRAGTASVTVLRSTAATTLAGLAADLAAADGSLTTSFVDTGTGATPTRLVVAAGGTGAAAAFTLDLSGYTGMTGGAQTLVQGRDAVVTLGTLTVQRASNTVGDLMPGVTLNLAAAAPGTDVTVTVARDHAAIAAKAQALVDAVNAVLTRVTELTKYDSEHDRASVLTGDRRASDLVTSLQGALQTAGAGALASLSQIGISFQRSGTYALDQDKLKAALASDFDGVAALLARTGEAVPADPRLAFVGATATTQGRALAYPVVITQAAARANLTGGAFATLAADDEMTVTVGSRSVTYLAPAGSTPDAVAAGLDDAFRTSGVAASASVVDGAVAIATLSYGSGASLTVAAGGTGLAGTATGVDVAGTIGGLAATGSGQMLTSDTGPSQGLSVKVSADAAGVAAAGGSLELGLRYSPGAVGALTSVLARLTGPNGLVTTAQASADEAGKDLNERIESVEQRLTSTRARYVRQFARLESMISQLRNQSSWLASQIASLPRTGGS